ncbi:MAG: DUF3822 family protein [Chitinophagales bacterium]|nr:DUF3822 family protein [Chitinophagales bacterium]
MYHLELDNRLHNSQHAKELCILVQQSSISGAIFDLALGEFSFLNLELWDEPLLPQVLEDKLKNWLSRHQQKFNQKFDQIFIGIDSPKFIVLPNTGIDILPAFQVLNTYHPSREIIATTVVEDDFNIHFSMAKSVWEMFNHHFEGKKFLFGDYGILKEVKFLPKDQNFLLAEINGHHLSLVYSERAHVAYYNQFEFQTKEDLLYYVALAYEELKLDRNFIPLLLYGLIEMESPLYQTLFGYVRNIRLAPGTPEYKASELLKETPPHFLNALLNLRK